METGCLVRNVETPGRDWVNPMSAVFSGINSPWVGTVLSVDRSEQPYVRVTVVLSSHGGRVVDTLVTEWELREYFEVIQ